MMNNGVETEVKYWNFFLSLMADYTDVEDTEIRILPFLSILNDRDENAQGNKRILSLLQKLDPSHKAIDPNYYADFLQDKKDEIFELIKGELETIDFSEVQIFGISAKYNQWLPGMILAEEVKKIAPHVHIIVGGFGSDQVAKEAMKLCAYFDFTTWGEGEYPLLELSKQLATEAPDLTVVPRIVYREADAIMQSLTIKSEYLAFDNYIYPDYDDFVTNHPDFEDNDQISIPINTIRSCHWGRCKFCDFNKGYKLRMRSPECVVNEIAELTQKYGISTFTFVDSDTFGTLEHFNKLLDLLIALRYQTEEDFVFWAEIIPNNKFDSIVMEKMSIAGFKNIFIGFDALTDTLLKKMNKSNSFSDNIFFVKDSLKNGINPLVNVIKHVPDETEADVQESANNLHFLRFFYNNSIVEYTHTYVNLVLSSMTKYFALLSAEEHMTYNQDDYSYLLPAYFSNNENRFHLFRYAKNAPYNVKEWEKLVEIQAYYKSNKFSYKMLQADGVYYYTEYCNDMEIANVVFGEPEYAYVIESSDPKVSSFDEFYAEMKKTFPETTEERLKEILANLKESYLVYCNDEFSNIVSIISTHN